MTSCWRTILAVGCLGAAMAVRAQDTGSWGTSRYVRIGGDRVVVFSHGSTFDLQRDAAWDIADSDQKKRFEAWVNASGLPKDPSQFVADLPASRQVPLAGEIQVGTPSAAGATLALKLAGGAPVQIWLLHSKNWTLARPDRPAFETFATKLSTSLPTLLVALSGASKPTEPVAWQKLVERSATPGGFVTLLGGSKEALWTHRAEGLPAPAPPAAAHPAAKAAPSSAPPAWVLPVAGGGGLVVLGAVLFAVPGVRTRVLGSVAKAAPAAFPVGAHERELILKVREEGKRRPPPANSLHSEEEYAVGMMLDRYNGYETLSQELERTRKQAEALAAYRDYQERYEDYEKRNAALKQDIAKREAELAKLREARKELQERLKESDTNLEDLHRQHQELAQALTQADALLRETGEWCKAVTERLNAQAAKIHNE